MKILRPIPIVEVEAEFLRAEWYKDFYEPVRKQFENIVKDKDYTNEENNRIRKNLLWQYRSPVLEKLPSDIHWYGISVDEKEFGDILIIRETGWEKTFGTAKNLKDTVLAIKNNVPDQGVGFQLIEDIKNNIGTYPFEEKLIIISKSATDHHSIIEGNHRGMAFQMKFHETGNTDHFPKEIILGISPNMHLSPWLNG